MHFKQVLALEPCPCTQAGPCTRTGPCTQAGPQYIQAPPIEHPTDPCLGTRHPHRLARGRPGLII
ncbi:hypothetical protein VDGL01_08224 [Verticillium dahliae]